MSESSLKKLESCDKVLSAIVKDVSNIMPIIVLEGHRSNEDQEKAFKAGKSKLRAGQSKHNSLPSKAVDIAPFPVPDKWGAGNSKEMAKFYFLAGVMIGVAKKYNVKLRFGGDWDGDFDFKDNTFDDLVHFEI